MVKPVATVNIVPKLPKQLERLTEIAYNMRWAWDHETIQLFRRISPTLWEQTGHNPVWMLGLVSQQRLEEVCKEPSFLAHLDRVTTSFNIYMAAKDTWYDNNYQHLKKKPRIAYFSMEFGLTECLQNYSGGLGILSGDHLKSASDLNIPLVGVGLLYQEGYFQQYLNSDGWQQERYPINDYANLPVTLQRDKEGNPIKISVPMPGRELYAQIWKVQVGRVPLYLLDSNIPDNTLPEDRDITDRLYGGDRRTRIRQEILLGIGGIRALEALGLRPDICHMNEGHSAFLLLERIRIMMKEHNLSFHDAEAIVSSSLVFTIHTPVPAGLERFGFDLIDEHFTEYMKELGLSRDEFINLGRENMGNYELFSLSVMAIKHSSGANGVAQLHGEVSRNMWQWVYPNVPEKEVPIGAITNGIHVQTWISPEMGMLLDRYLDPNWRIEDERRDIWQAVDEIPDAELWRTNERRRERLVAFTRRRLREQLINRGAPHAEIEEASEVLNPDALTICFARRFATYKRATLIFKDLERLDKLVNNPDRPVQFIFAGKAHPHDNEGKALIREIVNVARMPQFRHAIVFLENYDMNVTRYMLQGCDVWLNNPRRPKEASGTSGMKVIYNGGLNCSILDGWWAEAYSADVGWAIGKGEQYSKDEEEHQDHIESQALYNVLEQDIVPLFYTIGRDGVPRGWLKKVKESMKDLSPFFSTRRMVQQYVNEMYMPSFHRFTDMYTDDINKALAFAHWRQNLENEWHHIEIFSVTVQETQVTVGTQAEVTANIQLGSLTPDDILVQLYMGSLDTRGEIADGTAIEMTAGKKASDGTYDFKTVLTYDTTGNQGLSVRVLPKHKYLHTNFQPGLITWAGR